MRTNLCPPKLPLRQGQYSSKMESFSFLRFCPNLAGNAAEGRVRCVSHGRVGVPAQGAGEDGAVLGWIRRPAPPPAEGGEAPVVGKEEDPIVPRGKFASAW